MSTRPPEQRLGEFVASLEYDALPADVIETIRRAFVDTVGVTIAGAVDDAGKVAARRTEDAAGGTDLATLLGPGAAERPESAALRLGTASHALDYDDLSWALDGHPSVTLVPPLLALAADTEATGRDLVSAYAAGFEVESAIASPITPAHYEAGWHATSTFGTFGATAAAAHVLGLETAAVRRALNIAASMPSGLKRNFGSMTKPLHAGLCSRSGVTAALLARDGFTADDAAISGERGFWDLYSPEERGAFEIGESWTLESAGIHVKAYPCCYFTHTSIAATRRLVEDGVDPEGIEHIEVEASRGAADALDHHEPTTGLEAKFSMEHTVACAALYDRVGLAAFEESAIDDPGIERLRALVDFTVDETLPYDSHEATVEIVTDEGSHVRHQQSPPGTHDDPLSDDELRSKFMECSTRVIPEADADRLYDTLTSLESTANVSAAMTGD